MTESGGSNNDGVVFSFNPTNGEDSVLLNFNNTNGSNPYYNLIQAGNGFLYGMTVNGGNQDSGVLFSYNPINGKDTVLINFDSANGTFPMGGMLQASNGLLYGYTDWGGSNCGCNGVLFSYSTITGKDSVLVNFNGSNGSRPSGQLIQASNGLLYGTTGEGGSNGVGVLFSYNPLTGDDSLLIDFNSTIGKNPTEYLIQANDGNLYGMTQYGGINNKGVLFSYNITTGKDSVLLNFDGTNGAYPDESLIQASNSLLYGTTYQGGTFDYGVLFSYNITTGKDSVLLSFDTLNGTYPGINLIEVTNLYDNVNSLPVNINSAHVSVYPNPSNGVFQLKIENGELKMKNIEIYNMLGEKIASSNSSKGGEFCSLPSGGEGWAIDLSNQPAGIYLYRVVSENGEYIGSGKIVIE
ncbi:MAG: choice-of-anchor tandem repeat GloVer-containing protein [Bacteroidia bacterium]